MNWYEKIELSELDNFIKDLDYLKNEIDKLAIARLEEFKNRSPKNFEYLPVKDYTDDLRYIRSFLYDKRRSNQLNQKELAEKAGVSLKFVRELEKGVKTNFNTDSIQKVLNLFGGVLTVSENRDKNDRK